MTRILCALVSALALAAATQAATITVTGNGDTSTVDGLVTLREAIDSVNGGANVNADVVAAGSYGTSDTIHFNIAGAGVHTISPAFPGLPSIIKPVIIDGYSQPGSSANTLVIGDDAVLNIEIVGPGAASGLHGFTFFVGGDGSVIRGLVIKRFFFGIQVNQVSNVTLEGNFIGTDPAGTMNVGNQAGINVTLGNFGNHTIGGSLPAQRNVISGNLGSGIAINSQLPTAVLGNYVGLNPAGTAALPNAGYGIAMGGFGGLMTPIAGPTIGGPTTTPGTGAGNVISGNGLGGILISQSGAGGIPVGPGTIRGNIIGLDAAGTTAVANGAYGLLLDGGGAVGPITIGGPGAGNVISGNPGGIRSVASDTTIQGNYIGTDITGMQARPNTLDSGIRIDGVNAFRGSATIGGSAAGEGNVISSNGFSGVAVRLSMATIQGNWIGTAVDGTTALGNLEFGVLVDSSAVIIGGMLGGGAAARIGDAAANSDSMAAGEGNIIANNGDAGVKVQIFFPEIHNASDATILGNSISQNGLRQLPAGRLGINLGPDLVTPNDVGDADTGPIIYRTFRC